MLHNVFISDFTGHKKEFDLEEILESSPYFEKTSNAPKVWDMNPYATVTVTNVVAITPHDYQPTGSTSVEEMQRFMVEQTVKTIAAEAAYVHRCEVQMQWNQHNHLHVTLKPFLTPKKTVLMGNYFQKSNEKEPVQWLVLEQKDGEALLLSKFALHTRGYWMGEPWEAYKDNGKKLCWENSELRKWLNGEFRDLVFSHREQMLLLDTRIQTDPEADGECLDNQVFLLSEEQVQNLLPNNLERCAATTEFAAFGGAHRWDGFCAWWILPRVEGSSGPVYLQAVLPNGELQYHSRNVAHKDWCLRPAVRVSTEILATLPKYQDKAAQKELRIALDGQRLHFLRVFLEDGKMDRVSIDVEEAHDSHYELSAAAAKRLDFLLAGIYGHGDMVKNLRKFFQSKSVYDLVRLMNQNGIAYQSFHF